MKIEHKAISYASGGAEHKMDKKFDYLLFRQDFNGAEYVNFNLDEIDSVYEKIEEGEILIHGNYSILYAKNKKLMESAPDFGCYCLVKK
jgi:hypothetical protein